MKKENLKIAHIHVWDKNNKGDVAIVLAVQEILRKKFINSNILDFPVESLKVFDKEKIEEINSCDFVIIGGGGIFYSYFLPFNLKVIEAITSPIFLFGLGYIKEVDAPLWSPDKTESVIALVNKAAGVGVRDLNTKRFLLNNGISEAKVKLVGDPAVFLSEIKPSSEFLKNNKLEGKKIRLGINLNYSGWLGFGKWRKDILKAYRETVLYFQKEFGAEIYYLQHHPGEDNIYPELNISNLHLVNLSANEQKYVYGKMDLVIGMMLHVGVMTFGALSPEISVAYDIRNYGFAEFIGKEELVVDLDKLQEGLLLERSKGVFSQKEAYKKDFNIKKEQIYSLISDFFSDLEENL